MYSIPPSMATTDLFTVSLVLPFRERQIVGILEYVAFSDWLLSCNNMNGSFLHDFLWLGSSFLFSINIPGLLCVDVAHDCTCSLIEGHLGCL